MEKKVMSDEKNKYEIKAVLKADTRQIKQVQKKLDKLCRSLEKANSRFTLHQFLPLVKGQDIDVKN